MKTQELFSILKANTDKALLFEYGPQQFVGANYHITEVKHLKIDAVDCGARSDSWNETIIQLWESPKEKDKTEFMSVLKALGILNKVAKMKPYDLDSEVKFEYSNETFHTAQLYVNDFEIQGYHLIFKLAVQKTDCKAKTLCGVAEKAVEVTETVKEKVEACCARDSGCC
ncbi:hypothetical protein H7U19_01140 [Hyunsoonleella sp. SJ7]|uniref:Uncharacterized protein n=1 Tax=Hyunsoonleella aquatilis TaxID=2762758 RepID=A0A923H9P4_9FLAO|nr:DUF6428 family protein [Hyunsoonleella aquatilis]MBC3756989.1 hypothetical protein [Hyunsoonleella aquatilis]